MRNFKDINKYGSLYLTNICEPIENALFLQVKESTASKIGVDVVIGDKTISNCHEVLTNEFGCKFNISFQSYVAYQVTNESFLNFNDWDEYEAG